MKELLTVIANGLVTDPSSVTVEEEVNGNQIVLHLHVAPEDMGKVIGKQGKIAKAIRTVVKAASSKEEKRVIVDII